MLEGLTNLPFPRDSGLCTRFATQITFSRKPVDKITVSIIPAENAATDHAERLRNWKRTDLQILSRDTFGRILSEVCTGRASLVTDEYCRSTVLMV